MRSGGDRERLFDILEAIDRIERYAQRGRETFDSEELIQTWIVHHLQIIGEATREISDDFKTKNSHIPWKNIIGMRHVLVHDYLIVDLDVVWSAATIHVPALKIEIERMLKQFPTD
jgi:uncharacterized protein with HEPN domain